MTEQEPMADLHLTGFCVLPSGDVLLDLYAPGGMHHALVDYEGLREVGDAEQAGRARFEERDHRNAR